MERLKPEFEHWTHSRSLSEVVGPTYFHFEHIKLSGLAGPNKQVPSFVKMNPFEQRAHLS